MESALKNNSKLTRTQRELQKSTEQVLDRLIELTEASLNDNQKCNAEELLRLKESFNSATAGLKNNQKELYQGISKQGKLIDKLNKIDFNLMSQNKLFESKTDIFSSEIAVHFLREGEFDLAELFIKESMANAPDIAQDKFSELHIITRDLRNHELSSSFEWMKSHKGALKETGFDLNYLLHRQRYLQILQNENPIVAHEYIKLHLACYLQKRDKSEPSMHKIPTNSHCLNYYEETRKLMGMLVYAKRLETSPYKSYFTETAWESLIESITSAFCVIFGLPLAPPLTSTVNAGLISLPMLSKYLQLVQAKTKKSDENGEDETAGGNDVEGSSRNKNPNNLKNTTKVSYTNWYEQKELAAEIPLPDNLLFHSVFACPVSKEQSTAQNPPMMMPCGHTICKESLEKLAKSFRGSIASAGKLKCPYCPELSHVSQAKNVYF